jgi:hypothetical protein
MRSLFSNADRFVVIYSSNKVEPIDALDVRHRRFTDWIEAREPQWRETGCLQNKYPWIPSDLPKRPSPTSISSNGNARRKNSSRSLH